MYLKTKPGFGKWDLYSRNISYGHVIKNFALNFLTSDQTQYYFLISLVQQYCCSMSYLFTCKVLDIQER